MYVCIRIIMYSHVCIVYTFIHLIKRCCLFTFDDGYNRNTHIYIHTQTCIHIHMHTRSHTFTHICAYIKTHRRRPIRKQTYTYSHICVLSLR
uniref:Uncharacterized protein n=1 Tax=Octopus bimaculoides TaxID=37653 RepID=A0A0L8H528_OCTBM